MKNRISVLVAASALGAAALTAGCSNNASKSAGAGSGGSTAASSTSVGNTSDSGANPGTASTSSSAGSPTSNAPTAPASSSSTTTPHAATAACTTAEMPSGTWRVVPDSQGAGHVAADLTLQNTSSRTCTVAGFPAIALLASNDRTLPSYVVKNTAVPVTTIKVAPGAFIHAEMRYSPNVPGPGEPENGQCEPTTVHAQAQLPGDTAWAHITLDNPTTVCEKGELQVKPFVSGQSSPDGG